MENNQEFKLNVSPDQEFELDSPPETAAFIIKIMKEEKEKTTDPEKLAMIESIILSLQQD
jgi:hypothetical protein